MLPPVNENFYERLHYVEKKYIVYENTIVNVGIQKMIAAFW